MVPWNKLPNDLQKAILTMIIVFGGTSASCRLGPMICDPPPPPSTTPMICDPPPPPPSTPSPTTTSTITATLTASPTSTPMICDPAPPPPPTTPGQSGRPAPAAARQASPEMQDALPLAEIRAVDIVWQGAANGLVFSAETPWPDARYRWSVSGGSLAEESERVVWQPPAEPGRYLLQVVADWGRMGLAVDTIVLVVDDEGNLAWG